MTTKVFKQILMMFEIVFNRVKLLFYIFVFDCYMSLPLPLVTLSLKLMFIVFKTNVK